MGKMDKVPVARELAELDVQAGSPEAEEASGSASRAPGKSWEQLGGKDKERGILMTNLNASAGEVVAARLRMNRAKAELNTAKTEMLKLLDRYESVKAQLLKLLP